MASTKNKLNNGVTTMLFPVCTELHVTSTEELCTYVDLYLSSGKKSKVLRKESQFWWAASFPPLSSLFPSFPSSTFPAVCQVKAVRFLSNQYSPFGLWYGSVSLACYAFPLQFGDNPLIGVVCWGLTKYNQLVRLD